MDFVELSEQEFAKLDFRCKSFLQSVEMYRRYQDLKKECYLVGVKRKGEIVAAGLMVGRAWKFGKRFYRMPAGPLLDYARQDSVEILKYFTEKVRNFCKQKGGMAVEISPNIVSQSRDRKNNVIPGEDNRELKRELEHLGYKYLGEYEQVKWKYVLELDGREKDELFADFRTDHRQRIRRAMRDGVKLRELGDDELEILKQIVAESGERHGFQEPDLEYFQSMKRVFGDKIKFMVAEVEIDDKTVPLVAAMFVNDGRELVYLYSGSVRQYQKYGGAHLLQWQMIQEAMDTGCERYNFYGVKPVEGNGVYNFKQGFRGHVEELLGTFVLPIGFWGKLYVSRLKPREFGDLH